VLLNNRKMKSLMIFLIFIGITTVTYSQNKELNKVSIDKLTSETQFSSDNMDYIEMFWWLPTEFWKVVFEQDATIDPAEINEIIDLVNDYAIVVVAKGKIGMFGGVKYESAEDLKMHTQVHYKNELLQIVESENLPTDLNGLFSLMKPMLSNMMGNMGENLHFFAFQNPKGKKVLPINAYEEGELFFEMDGFSAGVDLPLSSLLEEKTCPVDKKSHNGKWIYCPFHGNKLTAQ